MADSLLLSALALLHNPWRARMYLSANTAVGTAGVIPYSTVTYDPSSMCTTGASAKITVPVDGYYMVVASSENATTSVSFYTEVTQNGSAVSYGAGNVASGTGQISTCATIIKCVAGDTIQVIIGTATTVVGSSAAAYLAVAWIAPA